MGLNKTFNEPYRFFFSLGALFAIWGVGVWVLFSFKLIQQFPRDYHAILMISGFLNFYASGFLMTAIPRMTRTSGSTLLEILMVMAPILLMPLFFGSYATLFFVLVSQLALLKFLGVRFIKRNTILPSTFMFVGVGVISSIVGILFMILGHNLEILWLYKMGHLFYAAGGRAPRLEPWVNEPADRHLQTYGIIMEWNL